LFSPYARSAPLSHENYLITSREGKACLLILKTQSTDLGFFWSSLTKEIARMSHFVTGKSNTHWILGNANSLLHSATQILRWEWQCTLPLGCVVGIADPVRTIASSALPFFWSAHYSFLSGVFGCCGCPVVLAR